MTAKKVNHMCKSPGIGCVILAVFGFYACGTSGNSSRLRSDAVLFDVFTVNYAWGFDCGGCYVDASGHVHRYDCSALRDTIRSEQWRGRERELLERRFHMIDSVICRVESTELESMRILLQEAAKTPPAEEVQSANDAGSTQFTAYLYGQNSTDSIEVLLATSGDFSRKPSSAAADTLVKWLRRACSCRNSDTAQ